MWAVVGTSQGGFIALRMALLAPGRVSGLAVLGTSAEAEDEQIAAGYDQMAEVWLSQGPDTVIDAVAQICLGDHDASDWTPKWRQVPGERLRLVLHGTADLAYPVAKAEAIVAALHKAELVTVDGGPHFLSLTHAAEVNPRLGRFLSALP